MTMSVTATNKKDSLVLDRIYEYQQTHTAAIDSIEDQVYAKFRFNVEKRNPVLWLIPSMYVMAKDPRQYEGEIVAPGGHLLVRADLRDVDVRDDAEADLRLAASHESGRGEEAAAAERAQRAGAAADEKVSACDVHYRHSFTTPPRGG